MTVVEQHPLQQPRYQLIGVLETLELAGEPFGQEGHMVMFFAVCEKTRGLS